MIGVIKRLSVNIALDVLLRIYKSFIRHDFHQKDAIYDKPSNESFKNKIENIQYKACIAITGAIQETSHELLYEELSLKSLEHGRWYQNLIFFHKIVNGAAPKYLTSYLNTKDNTVCNTRASY